MKRNYDLLIIGGGINGASIARAAALAGQSVLLVEQGDLAQATSSASTKLVHGGLRYLEQFEFKLVRESLRERAITLRTAPHIAYPLKFQIPHHRELRAWPVLRAGLLLYDLFALGGGLPRSRAVVLNDESTRSRGQRGLTYWDGWVDDARLVVLNAMDAAAAGATILTRTRFEGAQDRGGRWQAELRDPNGQGTSIDVGAIVNAAGPWVSAVLAGGFGMADTAPVRLVRGSHIVLRRATGTDSAYLLQQDDARVVFAIPYERDFTLVGTTDTVVERAEDAAPTSDEIAYLLRAANAHFTLPVREADIVWKFAGVRALYDDGSSDPSDITRDYRLELRPNGLPKLLSVYGGKLTTARHLAQVALARLGIAAADTRDRMLPGGDTGPFGGFLKDVRQRWPFLGERRSERMARAYGTRISTVLGSAGTAAELGEDFGAGLTRAEVDYLVAWEWARTTEDIVWRRTKLALLMSEDELSRLDRYLSRRVA